MFWLALLFIIILPFNAYANGGNLVFSSNGTQIQVNHDVYFSGTEKKSGFDITIPYTEVVTSKYSFEQKSDRDDDFSVVYGRIRYDSKLIFYHNGMIDGEVQDLVNKELRGSVAISKAKDGATVIEFLMPVRKSTTGKIYIYFKTDKSFVSQPISGLIEFKYYTVSKRRKFFHKNAGTIGKWTMGGVFLAAGATVAIIAAPAVLTATAVGGAVAGVLGGTLTGMEIGEIVGNEVQDRIKDSIQEIKNKRRLLLKLFLFYRII